MESVDLQMEDIFGEGEADEDLFTNHASIPDLPPDEGMEGGAGGGDNIENDAVLARLRDLSKGAAKRTVRVQPKLDPTRLTGDRGIGVLPTVFKDVKFKGKGHEAEDLRKVMRFLEHWTHRLFPKMPFDEVLERIEKLGTKREVQTYIKRMRLDIPLENESNAVLDEAEDIFDSSINETKQAGNVSQIGDDEEVLEELIREEEEQRSRQSQQNPPTPLHSNPTCQSTPATPVTPATPNTTTSVGLTAEQLERIEANKRKAQERRLAKLGQKTPDTPSSSRPDQVNTPLMYPSTPSYNKQITNVASQALSASPVVTGQKGDNSGKPRTDDLTSTDQLTEDQLLADLGDNAVMDAQTTAVSSSTDFETQPDNSTLSDEIPMGVASPDDQAHIGVTVAEPAENTEGPAQEETINMEIDSESASLSILD